MGHMSKGIGKQWIHKYMEEVYGPRDGVVLPGGALRRPPRYYDAELEKINPKRRREIETERQLKTIGKKENLEARELNQRARLKLKRSKL
jgi:hypothetical protein